MDVLVTNDDGVHAPGLLALAVALGQAGHQVTVAAPLEERSGSGAAIGLVRPGEGIVVEEFALEGLTGSKVFGVDGPPAMAVVMSRLGGFGEAPEIVVAGVNPGCNTGRSVLHSGTVGAALTAANFGGSGLAVSIDAGDSQHWSTATALAVGAVDWLDAAPKGTVLNLNVPNVEPSALRGVRRAELAPFGTVRSALVPGAPSGRLQLEWQATGEELDAGTDTALVGAGFAAVTALQGVRGVEVTGLDELERLLHPAESGPR